MSGKCEAHGKTDAACWCENCCQQMSDDACEKARLQYVQDIDAMKHKDCELCPFLGNGDPAVDETAAAMEWWLGNRDRHTSLREYTSHEFGASFLIEKSTVIERFAKTRVQAIVALWREVAPKEKS